MANGQMTRSTQPVKKPMTRKAPGFKSDAQGNPVSSGQGQDPFADQFNLHLQNNPNLMQSMMTPFNQAPPGAPMSMAPGDANNFFGPSQNWGGVAPSPFQSYQSQALDPQLNLGFQNMASPQNQFQPWNNPNGIPYPGMFNPMQPGGYINTESGFSPPSMYDPAKMGKTPTKKTPKRKQPTTRQDPTAIVSGGQNPALGYNPADWLQPGAMLTQLMQSLFPPQQQPQQQQQVSPGVADQAQPTMASANPIIAALMNAMQYTPTQSWSQRYNQAQHNA